MELVNLIMFERNLCYSCIFKRFADSVPIHNSIDEELLFANWFYLHVGWNIRNRLTLFLTFWNFILEVVVSYCNCGRGECWTKFTCQWHALVNTVMNLWTRWDLWLNNFGLSRRTHFYGVRDFLLSPFCCYVVHVTSQKYADLFTIFI
jgi:hypothetical protein